MAARKSVMKKGSMKRGGVKSLSRGAASKTKRGTMMASKKKATGKKSGMSKSKRMESGSGSS